MRACHQQFVTRQILIDNGCLQPHFLIMSPSSLISYFFFLHHLNTTGNMSSLWMFDQMCCLLDLRVTFSNPSKHSVFYLPPVCNNPHRLLLLLSQTTTPKKVDHPCDVLCVLPIGVWNHSIWKKQKKSNPEKKRIRANWNGTTTQNAMDTYQT